MKICIAGKITGDDSYVEKFSRYAKMIEEQGHTALNPAILPEGLTRADYMRICIAMIDTADVVLFALDAPESAGAQVEWNYCKYINKPVTFSPAFYKDTPSDES